MNKISEFFKRRKQEREEFEEFSKFFQDLIFAKSICNDFKINLSYVVHQANGIDEHCSKVIEDHNLEFCFIPTIWDTLNRSKKIACIIELSKKYCKTPLTIENFIYDINKKDFYNYADKTPAFNCYLLDEVHCIDIVLEVLDYENKLHHLDMLQKVEKYKSIDDFKNLDEIKYFVTNLVEYLPSDFKYAVSFASTVLKSSRDCMQTMINMFYNVGYFNKDYKPYCDELCKSLNSTISKQQDTINKRLGDTLLKQDENVLKIFYEVTKSNILQNCSFDKLKNKFLTNVQELEK